MSADLERELRDALRGAVDGVEPVPGSLDAIERRVAGHHRKRWPVVVAVAAAAATVVGVVAIVQDRRREVVNTTVPRVTNLPEATAEPAEPSGPAEPIGSIVRATAITPSFVYVLSSDENGNAGPVKIAVYDRAQRRVRQTTTLAAGYSTLAASGVRIWVGSPERAEIAEVTSTGAVTVALPEPPTALSGAGLTLWIGTAHHLYAFDTATKRITWSQAVTGEVVSISTSPDQRTVYDLVNERPGHRVDLRSFAQRVEARTTATGALLAQHDINGPGGGTLTAVADGVWVAAPTGTLGAVRLLKAGTLAEGPSMDTRASNGVTAVAAGTILWVYDVNIGSVVCADPRTGAVRDVVRPETSTPSGPAFAADATTAYLVDKAGVAILMPSPKCR